MLPRIGRSARPLLAVVCCATQLSAQPTPTDHATTDRLVQTGYAQLEAGEKDAAFNTFAQVLEIDATHLEALLGQAMLYAERQEHASAYRCYDQIVQLRPGHAFAWNGRGLAAFNLEHFDVALDSFQQATQQGPSGFFYESLAWTRLCRGEFELAAQSAKQASLLYNRAGEHSLYPLLIAYFAYLENADRANADRALSYASANSNDQAWPQPVLAYLAGKITGAEMISFVSSLPEETEAHTYIGLQLRAEGAFEAATKHFDWVIRSGDRSVFEHTLARAVSLRSSVAKRLP
jgi:tetratricopeptide (TPR) repeat protein